MAIMRKGAERQSWTKCNQDKINHTSEKSKKTRDIADQKEERMEKDRDG